MSGVLEDRRTVCLKVMLARKNPQTERKIPHLLEGYPVVVNEYEPLLDQNAPSLFHREAEQKGAIGDKRV